MLAATLRTMASLLLFFSLVNTLPIMIEPIDGVSSSPEAVPSVQMIIQFSLPDPLLDDRLPMPQPRPGRYPSSPNWVALTSIHGTSDSKSLEINIEDDLDINHDRFAFDLHPSLLSPYHSLINTVYRAFRSIVNTFNYVLSILKHHHENSPTFSNSGDNAALYEGLQSMTLEEEFGDDAIYPNLLESTQKEKKATRKVKSWIKFDKIVGAFISGSSKSPPTKKVTRKSPPKTSQFHRGIKDAVRQA
jgi:hypothetical protein